MILTTFSSDVDDCDVTSMREMLRVKLYHLTKLLWVCCSGEVRWGVVKLDTLLSSCIVDVLLLTLRAQARVPLRTAHASLPMRMRTQIIQQRNNTTTSTLSTTSTTSTTSTSTLSLPPHLVPFECYHHTCNLILHSTLLHAVY